MNPISSDAGRAGDIWQVEAADKEVTIEKVTKYWIAVNSGAEPAGTGRAYPFDEWDRTLQRIREDVTALNVGDLAHVYVPPTKIYVIDIVSDESRQSGYCWFSWNAGQIPTPEIEDSGLYFDPAEEWNLVGELVHRPYPMLRSGDTIADASGAQWEYTPPFRFVAADGQSGIPAWPLTILGEPDLTKQLNQTSHSEQLATWEQHAGVPASVFNLDWPTF